MTTAFALSGGGSLGAVQVGMLRALTAHGVRADVVVGASVGALNGLHYAARPNPQGVAELARRWIAISRHDVSPFRVDDVLQAVLGNLPRHPLRGVQHALGMENYAFPLRPGALGSALLGRRNYVIPNDAIQELLAALHAYNLMQEQRLDAALDRIHGEVRVHVIPPLCPVEVLPIDFRQTEHLIWRAARATMYWLGHGVPMPQQARDLGEVHTAAKPA